MDVASNTNHTVEAGTLLADPQTDEKGPFAESLELTQKEARASINSELLPDQKKLDANTSSQNWGGLRPKTPCPRATRPSRQDVLKAGYSKQTFAERGRRNEKVGMGGRENKSDGTEARKQQEIPATLRMSESEKASEYSGITGSGQNATPGYPGNEERVRKGFCRACAATETPAPPLERTLSKTRDRQANNSVFRVGLDGQTKTATSQGTESKNLGMGQTELTCHQALSAQKLTSKASGTKEEQQSKHATPVSSTPQSFNESRKKLPVEGCNREQNQPRGLLIARLPPKVTEVKIEGIAVDQNSLQSLETLSARQEPAVSTARSYNSSQENILVPNQKGNVLEAKSCSLQKTTMHPVQPTTGPALKGGEEKRKQEWREMSSAEEHTASSPELRSPHVEQQNHQEFTTARANTPDVKPTALQGLHEDRDVATAKGLSPHSTSASLSQVCDVQDITTAVAKSPDPKPMEFSFASIFPSLFGGSAPANESSSTPNTAAPLTLPTLAQGPPQFKPPEQPAKPQDSRRDVIQFRSEYANKFALGSEHTVDFFSGSYDDVSRLMII
ncbi:unnamed protein product [Haemonchus placei]|uniref:G protein-regulated inducer of neurite outgrowth 3 n=1 Tax=Haemonchus placei TaxID=6290 RepID=A0A0N4X4E0_HAEPC|nr:unnamed protein product [Haemonchus placei]